MSTLSSGSPMGQVPVGTIIAYAGIEPERWETDYWLLCDGKSLDSTAAAYSNLFNAIGDAYGSSGTQFNKPDLRGMFMRGVGTDTTNDPDIGLRYRQGDPGKEPITADRQQVGTVQDDQLARHSHALGPNYNGYHGEGDYSVYNIAPPETPNATGETGGSETRPKNVYVYYLIYAGPPIEAGEA